MGKGAPPQEARVNIQKIDKPRERLSPIPIVDGKLSIVGWTFAAPIVRNDSISHGEAEQLLGESVQTRQVQLVITDDIMRAGGPADWTGPWRCFAICSATIGAMSELDEFPEVRGHRSFERPPLPAGMKGRRVRRK